MEDTIDSVDSLIEGSFAPEPPMAAPNEGTQGSASDQNQVLTDEKGNQWVINHEGKEIPLDEHKFKMYAQKGYNYEGKMHQLRVDRNLHQKESESFSEQRKSWEAETAEMRQIQEFAKQNPQWVETVRQAWVNAQQGGQQQGQSQNPWVNQIGQLQNTVNQLVQRISDQDKQTQMRSVAEKEATLDTQIAKYKDENPSFDWNTADEMGMNLEKRIMQFAIDEGIKNVEHAAKLFHWDEHMKRTQLSAKEQVGKDIQRQQKLGLGTPTAKSQLQLKRTESVRGKSYDDIASEALKELGLS
jgi:hypothetical protein